MNGFPATALIGSSLIDLVVPSGSAMGLLLGGLVAAAGLVLVVGAWRARPTPGGRPVACVAVRLLHRALPPAAAA